MHALTVIPAVGSGLASLAATGQHERLLTHLSWYAETFDLTYLTWGPWPREQALWGNFAEQCDATLRPARGWWGARLTGRVRCLNLLATIPAILQGARFAYSYGADYPALARLHGRPVWKWRLLRGLAMRRARLVLVPNARMAVTLAAQYPRTRIVHHPNWVDCERFTTPPDEFIREPFILFVGRLVKEKQLDRLARAARVLGCRLVCLGAGPWRDRLRAEGIECPGPVPWPDLPAWYRRAAVFALPSWSEGHPKALAEAMACGTTCVVSNAVSDGGDAVIRTDALEEGLSEALRASDLYSRRARAWAVQHWDVRALMPAEIALLTTI